MFFRIQTLSSWIHTGAHVAGTYVCNHIVALLLQTAHYSELNVQFVPHSCTETEQQWQKPRTAVGVKTRLLCDIQI